MQKDDYFIDIHGFDKDPWPSTMEECCVCCGNRVT